LISTMMVLDKAACQALTGFHLLLDTNEYMASVETGVRDGYTVAGDPGFEPGLTDSESAVLPLD
jgi:hypothetical protein